MFKLFSKGRKASGRVAFYLRPDGVALAYAPDAESPLRCTFLEGAALEADAVGACLKEWQALGCEATVVLSPRSYQLLLVEAPDVAPDEMAEALRWRVKDRVAFDVADAVIDFFPLPEDAFRGRARMLYVVVMEAQLGQSLDAQVKAVGARLTRVEIPEMALLRLHRHLVIEGAGCALLGLQPPVSLINLVADGDLYLSRQLETSKELLKGEAQALESQGGSLVLDIQRSLDYYESQLGKPPCIKLLIAPQQEGETPLLEQLRYNLALEITQLDLGEHFHTDPPLSPLLQQHCLLALAAVLAEVQP